MRQNFVAQFVQLLKRLLCDVWSVIVMEKNQALSLDQDWLQTLQFSVHLINLLSILLRCDGFAGIQKGIMNWTSSRPPNSDHDLFRVHVQLWEVLQSFFFIQRLSQSVPVIIQNPLLIARHTPIKKWYVVVVQNKRRQHFKMTFKKKFSLSS